MSALPELKVHDVLATFDTHEDHFPIMEAPMSEHPGFFKAINTKNDQGKNETQLISIIDNSTLVHFRHENSSSSGWKKDNFNIPVDPDLQAQSIKNCFWNGSIYSIINYVGIGNGKKKTVALKNDLQTDWTVFNFNIEANELLQNAENFNIANNEEFPFIFGQSIINHEDYFFVISPDAEGQWHVRLKLKLGQESRISNSFHGLLPGSNPNQMIIIRSSRNPDDGTRLYYTKCNLVNGKLIRENEIKFYSVFNREIAFDNIISIPFHDNSLHFLLISRGITFYLYNTEANFENLQMQQFMDDEGAIVDFSEVFIGLNGQNDHVLIGINANTSTLVTSRIHKIENGRIVYHPVYDLGDKAKSLACPTLMPHGTELFFVNDDKDLIELTEDPSDKCWHVKSIETHHPSDKNVESGTSHTLDLTTVTKYGSPVANTEIIFTSAHQCIVYIDGTTHKLDATHPVTFKTGHDGKIRLSIKAWELSTPNIVCRVPKISPTWSKTFAMDLAFHHRMSGADKQYAITEERLKSKNVLHERVDTEVAKEVVSVIKTAGSKILETKREMDNFNFDWVDTSPMNIGWHFQFGQSKSTNKVNVRQLNEEEMKTFIVDPSLGTTNANGDSPENLFDWIGDMVRKAVNYIKEIGSIVLKWVGNAMHVIIDGIGSFIAKTAQGFVSVIKLIIQKIALQFEHLIDAGKALLEFLKSLFEWQDIINTKRVFKHSIESFMDNVIKSVETDAVDIVHTKLKKIHDDIKSGFDREIEHLRDKNLKGLATPSSGNHPFDERKINSHHDKIAVQSNFVWHHLDMHNRQNTVFSTALIPLDLKTEIEQFFKDLITRINNENFAGSTDKILRWLKGLIGQDLNTILSTGLASILELLKDFLLLSIDLIEFALVAILKLIGKVLHAIKDVLNLTLPIPIIAPLYKKLTGDDLSSIDILCLLMAAPGTIFYKLLQFKSDPHAPFTKKESEDFKEVKILWGDLKHLIDTSANTNGHDNMTADKEALFKKFVSIKDLIVSIASIPQPTIDATLDAAAVANTPLPKISFFASWYSLFLHIGDGPLESIHKSFNSRDIHEHLEITYWSVSFLPVAGDVMVNLIDDGKVVRSYEAIGPIIDMVMGAVDLILGTSSLITAIVEPKPDYKAIVAGVGGVSASLTTCAKILIMAIEADEEPATKAALFLILMGIDEICGSTSVICHFIANPYEFGDMSETGIDNYAEVPDAITSTYSLV